MWKGLQTLYKFVEFDYKSNHANINHLLCIECADTKKAGDHGKLFPILTIVFSFLKALLFILCACIWTFVIWIKHVILVGFPSCYYIIISVSFCFWISIKSILKNILVAIYLSNGDGSCMISKRGNLNETFAFIKWFCHTWGTNLSNKFYFFYTRTTVHRPDNCV